MTDFFLTIDASSIYTVDAPTLEILINGSVVSSIAIDAGYSLTTYQLSTNGSFPSSFSFRFSDTSGETGRSISLHNVYVSGQDVNTNLSALMLNKNDTSTLDTMATDYLFGKTNPTLTEIGTPTIEGTTPTGDTDIINATTGDDIVYGYNGYNKVFLDDGDDRYAGGNQIDYIFGGDGNDLIYTSRGNDRIEGGNGDDLIFSHNDNDYVKGDAGNDTINLGNGNDRGYGGDDDDIIYGGGGNDLIYGDDGNDRLEGQNDNDRLYGGSGDDYILGGGGYDALYGDDGNDYLNGGSENDQLYGGNGNDTLRGGSGDDKLYGDDGNDDIRGGDGNDWLTGGAGADDIRGEDGNDLLFYDAQDNFWGGNDFDWLVMTQFDNSNIDFSNPKIRNGIEGVSMINWDHGAQANNLIVDAADIISNSDDGTLYVAGDIGLDGVLSTDYDITDRFGTDFKRGGHEYARFDHGGTELYIEVGLTLNGVVIA
ncbi:MAG TPA: calcium-binding protein [Alphaproteobacteria bacterium]|nr:calcium-binding protein [Alphaproteobacteria bacterium]